MDYSKDANDKKTNQKRSRRRKRKNSIGLILLRILFIVIVVSGFAVAGGLLGAYMGIIESTPPLNTVDVKPESYTSFIYDANGNEIDKLHGEENREYVQLSKIPKNLQNAVVAIEDERFYEHNGIDIKGIFRALVVNIKQHDMTQGASTITQQLIKNEVLSSEKKLKRKIQEQYLAVNFEKDLEKSLGSKKLAKDYILELYLNTISLNHGLNGVEAASKFYFGKDVSELTLAECASIAGITKNPSAYSPLSNPTKNKERQLLVLDKMKELGYITEQQYREAKAEDIYSKIIGNNDSDNTSPSIHSYFVDALIVQLAKDLVEQKNMNTKQAYNLIYSGGLKIESTVDMNMQSIMEDAYKSDEYFPSTTKDAVYTISIMDNVTKEQTHHTKKATVSNQEEAEQFKESVKSELLNSSNTLVLDNLSVTDSLQSAMTIMDFRNGEVKAIIGGRGEKPGDLVLNRATQSPRQPGSCFKPLAAYAPAIDLNLVMPGTVIIDEPFSVGKWSPKNWNGRFKGPCTVREGIRDSMNVLAAKTIMMVGPDRAYEYLLNFGFTTIVESDKGPATALGGITNGVTSLEITAAYSTIANGGEYNKPKFYTRVLDHDGKVLLENVDPPKRVLKETTAYLLTDMMKEVIIGGGEATGHKSNFRNIRMNISGKTGTTNDSKDLMFVGFTPYYCAGVWLGYDNPKPMTFRQDYHMILWRDIMEKIHQEQGLENKEFTKPDGIVTRSFCSASGDVPISGVCENDYYGNAIASDISAADFGSSTQSCNYHQSFSVDLSSGMLANEYCPSDSVSGVVLAIDPSSGEIANLPNPVPDGKVAIDIHSTCTKHNAQTKEQEEQDKLNQDKPLGSDDEEDPSLYLPDGNSPIGGNDITNSNEGTSSNTQNNNSTGENSHIPPTIDTPFTDNNEDNEGGVLVPPPELPPEEPVTVPDDNPNTDTDESLYIPD